MDSFDECVPLIPCFIIPQSKVSTFLSPKMCSFDLVILDEASQSDASVLPCLLRGKNTNYNQNSIPPDPSHENWLAMFEKSKTLANKFFPKLQHGFGNLIGAIPFVGVGRKKAAQMVENFIKYEGFVLDKRGSSSGFSEFDWNVVYRFMKIEKLVHEIRRMYGGLWPGLMADDDDRDWGKLSKFMKALVVIKRSEVSGSGSGSGSDISPALEVERAMLVDKRKKLLLKHIETKTLENLAKNFSPEAQSKLIR